MADRPNVILCLCDQLRAFEVGCYGNSVIRTPCIDALAAEGVRFETAVTTNPVCMAARSSLLSGQYNRTCTGGVDNVGYPGPAGGAGILPQYPADGRPHLPDQTLPEALRESGYETAVIGKWHIHTWPQDLGFESYLIPRVSHAHTGQSYCENGGPEFVPPGFSVDFEADRVAGFLEARRDADRPFFLYYSISPPHCPLRDAPEQYLSMYDPAQIPLRPNVDLTTPLANQDYWFRIYRWDFRYYTFHLPYTLDLPPDYDLRRLIADYYGLTTWVDDVVGRMMRTLQKTGLDKDTIVVFTSDHGDNLGSHGLVQKCSPNEEAIRIPLIVCGPGVAPGSSETIASLVDLMPTLLELTATPIPQHVQGRSLAAALGRCSETFRVAQPDTTCSVVSSRHRLYMVSERQVEPLSSSFLGVGDVPQAFQARDDGAFIEFGLRGAAIRTPRHLYYLPMDEGRNLLPSPTHFYDLAEDPYELTNLATSNAPEAPAGTAPTVADCAASLDARLRAWHRATPFMGRMGMRDGSKRAPN